MSRRDRARGLRPRRHRLGAGGRKGRPCRRPTSASASPLVEKAPALGGACVNTGTLPSKTLRETALYLSGFQRAMYGMSLKVDKRRGAPAHGPACAGDRAAGCADRANLERHHVRSPRGAAFSTSTRRGAGGDGARGGRARPTSSSHRALPAPAGVRAVRGSGRRRLRLDLCVSIASRRRWWSSAAASSAASTRRSSRRSARPSSSRGARHDPRLSRR